MEQRLLQSPQMIQAMQILQLNGLDLEERIEQELTENPLLEIAEPGTNAPDEGTPATPAPGQTKEAAEASAAEDRTVDAMLEELERYDRGRDPMRKSSGGEDAGDKKLEAMANTPDAGKTLAEALLEELAILDFDPRQRRLAEYLLYSLDDRGWLTVSLDELARDASLEGEEPVRPEEFEYVRSEIRRISHPSLGARDLKECLRLQLAANGLEDPLLVQLVENHLEDIEHNRLPRIAKATLRSLDDVKDAIELLKTLEPNPGSGYGEARGDLITPDVIVEELDGAYTVRLERERSRELRLSPQYRELLAQARKGDGVREWVRKRLESARWFIEAVQLRQNTLLRVSEVIFARQKSFLDKGMSGFQPLRMQEVADEVGVHISTVSRAVSGKYAQTPRGIFPLKFFFAGGTQKSTGEVASQVSIKQRLAEIVAQEDPDKPMSDDDLADKLEQLDHVRIARRTVTKYRKALNIPSSNERRRF